MFKNKLNKICLSLLLITLNKTNKMLNLKEERERDKKQNFTMEKTSKLELVYRISIKWDHQVL